MDLIYSIDRVFGEYLSGPQWKTYNIPEYQRGYKWSDQQINELLKDIYEFETGGDEDLFYCLQNITIVSGEGNKLNVVDGQQRLTTIALLLSYLGEGVRVKNKIHYAVRKPSNDFIQSVISNESDILERIKNTISFDKFLADSLSVNKDHDYDYQDIYFMYSAIQTFDNWFDRMEDEIDKESFKEKLLHKVKLIINRVENVSEQELFMNLNAGKIQLDGSDLVRAILITRVAKQEMQNYDLTDVKNVVRLNERRIRIGWELDEMNAWWSKKNVKAYFTYFTNLKTGEKESIKFDELKYPINLLYKLWAESKGAKMIQLSQFEAQETKAQDLYVSIVLLHRILKDWFEDREIYHYLGFLFAHSAVNFKEILNAWKKADTTRASFIIFLKTKVQTIVFGAEPEPDEEDTESGLNFWQLKMKDYNSASPTNWYATPQLEKILLVLDVIHHSKYQLGGMPLPFLRPQYFRNNKEDKEHIYPCTPKELKTLKKLSNPVAALQSYIEKLNVGYKDEYLIVWDCTSQEWGVLEDNAKAQKLEALKEQIHKKRPINSIGNLVLLHLSINRSFGNDYYQDKRQIVINNTEQGFYVRQHTLKVFVKQTENEDLNNWTMKDIAENADSIAETLGSFFNPKTEAQQI